MHPQLVSDFPHLELLAANVPKDIPMLLAYYNTTLALLLRIANARGGAGYVFNAGLFPSVRESLLFSIDPDIGLGKPGSLTSCILLAHKDRIREQRSTQALLRPHARRAPRHQRRGAEQRAAERTDRSTSS